jgi:hypothetical protein
MRRERSIARSAKESQTMGHRHGHGCVSAVLAAVAVVGFSACAARGGGGPAAVVQTSAPASSGTSAASTLPSVSPINDPKRLCSLAEARAQELVNAADAFWSLIQKPGWSFGDSEISSAADHVTAVADKVLPILQNVVGPSAPQDVAQGVKAFTNAARDFTEALGERAPDEDLVNFGKKFKASIDDLNHGCGY